MLGIGASVASKGTATMADQKSLRLIGLSFAAITAAVMLVAALLVADAMQTAHLPQTASASTING